MYKLSFSSYCGMISIPTPFDDRTEARMEVADSLRRTRASGRKVVTLTPGEEWEVLEPEGAKMVPDWAGTMHLRHHTYACRECGSECETRDAAADCCRFEGAAEGCSCDEASN